MCPFLDEDDNFDEDEYEIDYPKEDFKKRDPFFKDDKKFFIMGGIAAVITFIAIAYFLYSNSKPINLDDLPVIQADTTPIKIKSENNTQVSHQDKIVYDNISGEKRKKEKVHVIAPPEEVLSINEMDSDGVLSEEEKQKIINAFDELIPEKEYKIQYVKNENQNKPETKKSEYIVKSKNMKIVEEESLPPIKRIESTENTERKTTKKQKIKLSDLVNNNNSEGYDSTANGINSNIMVQIASLPTKNGAEVEYRRIANKNRFIKKFGKKIYKVDLGAQKGSRYRIQIGPFRNTAEARQVISELKNNGCSAYISR